MNGHTTTDLAEAIDELVWPRGYLHRLRQLLPQPSVTLDDGQGHTRKITGSPAPWNDDAASLLFDIHAGARRHEAVLRDLLGFGQLARGGSDRATVRALVALPDLVAAWHTRRIDTGTSQVARCVRDIERWPRLARRILDDDARPGEETLTKAPGGLVCPYCQRRLVLKPGWQHDPAPALHCLRCPATVTDDHPHGVDQSWEVGEWIGQLQADA